MQHTQLPADLIDVSQVAIFCPRCFVGGRPIPQLAGLTSYLEVLGQFYASASFATASALRAPQPTRFFIPDAKALFEANPYLGWTFADLGVHPAADAP